MLYILNLLAAIVAIAASVYLFYISSKTAKGLKTGFVWLAIGVSVGLAIHSSAEFLESAKIIDVELLVKIMPPLVLLGSLMILTGSIILYRTIKSVSNKK